MFTYLLNLGVNALRLLFFGGFSSRCLGEHARVAVTFLTVRKISSRVLRHVESFTRFADTELGQVHSLSSLSACLFLGLNKILFIQHNHKLNK